MPLPLAPDQDRTGSPVNIFELDCDDLRRAQTKAGEDEQHRIVAPTNRIGRPDRVDQLLDLLRLQGSRQVRVTRCGDARKAGGQITLGLPAPEQKAEQVPKVGRRRLVPVRLRSPHNLPEECDNIMRFDVVEIAERHAEPELHEALQEARTMANRRFGQTSLVAEIRLILGAQPFERRRWLLRRLRQTCDACFG